jgi:glycine/D-amino acid oxidase-like deaminating enzyme
MAKVAVVGAGIVGCMIARELVARSPRTSVTVLDRGTVGGGASRLSAGLHVPRGFTPRLRRMTEHSHARYRALVADRPRLPIRSLRLSVVARGSDRAGVEQTYVAPARLARDGAVGLDFVRVPTGFEVWRASGCQHADVPRLTQALAAEVRDRVRFREGVCVVAADPTRAGIVVRLGTGDTLTVDRLVLAPGPWLADPAVGALIAGVSARVKKIVAMHVERRPAEQDPAVLFHDDDAFLLPLPARGHWLFSYPCPEWDVSPGGLGGLTPDDVARARAILRRYAPDLAARCDSGRVGCDAYGDTGEPVVQAVKLDERIVFAGAGSGLGYRLAPAIAEAAVDLLGVTR